MAFSDFLKNFFSQDSDKNDDKEETFRCAKCGKEKNKSQGVFVSGGSRYCCKQCRDAPENPAGGACAQC